MHCQEGGFGEAFYIVAPWQVDSDPRCVFDVDFRVTPGVDRNIDDEEVPGNAERHVVCWEEVGRGDKKVGVGGV